MERRDILRRGSAGLVAIVGIGLAGCSGNGGSGDSSDTDDGSDDGDGPDLDSPEGVVESYHLAVDSGNEDEIDTVLHSESARRPIDLVGGGEMSSAMESPTPSIETEIVERDLDAQDIGFEWSFLSGYTEAIAEQLAEAENAWVEATLTYEDDEDVDDHLVAVEDDNWQLWY